MGQLRRFFLAAPNERGCVSVLADDDQLIDLVKLGFVEREQDAAMQPTKSKATAEPSLDDLRARAKELRIKGAHFMGVDRLQEEILKAEAAV